MFLLVMHREVHEQNVWIPILLNQILNFYILEIILLDSINDSKLIKWSENRNVYHEFES